MTKLSDKVQNALDEVRTLVLGTQVLIGFAFTATLEPRFEALPRSSQTGVAGALLLLVLTFAVLLVPTVQHRLVERGADTQRIVHVANETARVALLPFALVMGFAVFFSFRGPCSGWVALLAGGATTGTALVLWYGIEAVRRTTRGHARDRREIAMTNEIETTDLSTKVKHVLTEARVVLPGAQALLGFQFSALLLGGFEKLPSSSQHLHAAALAATTLATILLMTPAAYHRLVEHGENTAHFHAVAGRMVIASFAPLALGILGDFYVVLLKVSGSVTASALLTGVLALAFSVLWGVWPLMARAAREASADPRHAP